MTQPRDGARARILVVDDEPQNLELMEAILQDAEYEVFSALGGEEALALAHEKRPDLIILDLMMPGLSGFEVCARIKMDPQTGGIPVLFVTALNQIADKERALAVGGDDFLTKPIQYAELLARAEALLKVRHLNRDLDRALAYLHELELARHAPQPGHSRPALRPADRCSRHLGRGRRAARPAAILRHPSGERLPHPRGRERAARGGDRSTRDR